MYCLLSKSCSMHFIPPMQKKKESIPQKDTRKELHARRHARSFRDADSPGEELRAEASFPLPNRLPCFLDLMFLLRG